MKLFLVLALAFFTVSALAEPAADKKMVALEKAVNYLNTLTTYQAKFQQVNVNDGALAKGTFYLQRPRQFLWQYESPGNQKLVSDGGRMFFHDPEANQTTQLPLNVGLASILTKPNLKVKELSKRLVDYTESDAGFELTFSLTETDGTAGAEQARLSFQTTPLRLARLATTDNFGNETVMTFFDITEGQPIAANMFKFTPPAEGQWAGEGN